MQQIMGNYARNYGELCNKPNKQHWQTGSCLTLFVNGYFQTNRVDGSPHTTWAEQPGVLYGRYAKDTYGSQETESWEEFNTC